MKFETTKEKFLEAVALADRLTSKNLTLPILADVLLSVVGRTLTIRATNLDVGIEVSFPVKVDREGEVAVPGGILASVLSGGLQGNTVSLELDNQNLVVASPHGRTVIKSHTVEDFPTLPKDAGDVTFSIPAKDFVKGLRSVWYSASTSTIKPELASISVSGDGERVFFVATDSFRLAEKSILAKKVPEFQPILVPFRTVPEVIRILESVEGDVDVSFDENQLSFSADGLYVTSRLIDGTFPDYKQIIPKAFSTEVVVLKHDLLTVLKQAGVFSDKFNQVSISVKPSKKEFSISSSSADVGETVERVNAAVSGEDLDVRFNLKYILDCFQSIPSDSVSLSFSGLAKPLVIRGVSEPSFLYLVMPMNR